MSLAARAPRRAPAAARWGWVVAAVVAGLAFLVRWHLVGGSAGIGGYRGYDDGVYFSAAVALVHGRVPYRDFLLLHPPGSTLALTPFAALTTWTSDDHALVAARVGIMLVGAANAVLVTRVARRWGTTAAVVGGVLYALSYAAAWAERLTLLEPLGSLCLLGGVVLLLRGLDRRREGTGRERPWLWAGGAVLALGATVKIWGVVPLLVVLLWLLVVAGWRTAARAAVGAVVALVAVLGPFLLAAGSDMVRMVVLDQLTRPPATTDLEQRLVWLTGTGGLRDLVPEQEQLAVAWTVLGLATVAAVAAWVGRRGRLWVVLLAVQVGVLLLSPSAYPQYAAFSAPALVLVLAAACSLLPRPGRVAAGALLSIGATALLVAAVQTAPRIAPFPTAEVAAALPDDGCVRADSPGVLAVLDVLSRDLERGCELPVDLSGYSYDHGARDAAGEPVPRRRNLAWQEEALRYLTSGSSAVLVRSTGNGFSDETWRALDATTTTVLDRPAVQVLVPHDDVTRPGG
ncbi:phospholipid carrier-dependent glycosyltransferase [Cellulosimicrobium funkei]|uniref:phospholipid carrier-dependent glycosyltransferase n=1 Tax=Cellulosimicrobium funkei TaxID=264251 RepID=UPI0034218A59